MKSLIPLDNLLKYRMFTNKKYLSFIEKAQKESLDLFSVTVLFTEGSSYAKVGSQMFVDTNGNSIGILGGEALINKFLALGKEALEEKELRYFQQDLRSPTSTHGISKFLIEPHFSNENYGRLGVALNNFGKTLVRSTKSLEEYELLEEKRELFFYEARELFFQPITPPFTLAIFGADEKIRPIIEIAQIMGWRVELFCKQGICLENLNVEKTIELKQPEDIFTTDLNKYNSSIIMTHDFTADVQYLKRSMDSAIGYIGLMGNKKAVKQLITDLDEEMLKDPRLFAPIGLDIANNTPESIALAICGQIEAKRNGKITT